MQGIYASCSAFREMVQPVEAITRAWSPGVVSCNGLFFYFFIFFFFIIIRVVINKIMLLLSIFLSTMSWRRHKVSLKTQILVGLPTGTPAVLSCLFMGLLCHPRHLLLTFLPLLSSCHRL